MDRRFLLVTSLMLAAVWSLPADAGEVTLKNGTVIDGMIAPIPGLTESQARHHAGEIKTTPFVLIDQEYKRYFVGDQQVASVDLGQRLIPYDFFELPKTGSASPLSLGSVGLPRRVTPFDEYGGRTVTFNTQNGNFDLVQKVTRIGPKFLTIEGVSSKWWQGLATNAVAPEQLAKMIDTAIDEDNPDDRMSVARFYIQAGMHDAAANELRRIGNDFPELAEKAKELEGQLNALVATSLLAELRRRESAGQPRLAIAAAEAFPSDAGFDAAVLNQVQTLKDRYRETHEKGDRVLLMLGQLEAELDDPQTRSIVAGMRATVRERLDWQSVDRFDAFLTLATDQSLAPADRLALGYSGWIVGGSKATTDLPKALSLWKARGLMGEYLRSEDSARRQEILAELTSLEGVGPDAIADLIPYLNPWIETPQLSSGQVTILETVEQVAGWGGDSAEGKAVLAKTAGPVRYAAVLPPEYTPNRNYPMIVALRAAEWSIEQAAHYWGSALDGFGRPAPGPATKSGYIVIAPQYAPENQAGYEYTVREQLAILAAIRDAKKRFNVDGDRVFLAGHGMGGDAAFDIALSHSDLFAGAVPISGLCRQHVRIYRDNQPRIPFYVINGALDRGSLEVNAPDLGHMMKRGHDIIYCEFVGRGYEYYYEEIQNVLDWMGRMRRIPDPQEIEASVLRSTDDRHYWIKLEEIPNRLAAADFADPQGQILPRRILLKARITEGNAILVSSAARRYVLRLNGTMVDLDERVKVRLGGRLLYNDFLVPETAALLEDLRENGDRQRLYPIRLVVE